MLLYYDVSTDHSVNVIFTRIIIGLKILLEKNCLGYND